MDVHDDPHEALYEQKLPDIEPVGSIDHSHELDNSYDVEQARIQQQELDELSDMMHARIPEHERECDHEHMEAVKDSAEQDGEAEVTESKWIPNIIHQTWQDDDVPAAWKSSMDQWMELAAKHGWEYKFWSDASNREFLHTHYAWLTDFYTAMPLGIQRSHIMRYLYMFHFGGLYVDLNLEPKGDRTMNLIKSIRVSNEVVLAQERHMDDYLYVSTSFMMSVPKHIFFNMAIYNIVKNEFESMWTRTFRHYDVLVRTGSLYLTKQYERYQIENPDYAETVILLPESWIHPHGTEPSPYMSRITDGPTWRDWDSNVSEYGQLGWKYRDIIMLIVIIGLVLTLILVVSLR